MRADRRVDSSGTTGEQRGSDMGPGVCQSKMVITDGNTVATVRWMVDILVRYWVCIPLGSRSLFSLRVCLLRSKVGMRRRAW